MAALLRSASADSHCVLRKGARSAVSTDALLLNSHVSACRRARGRAFALRCWAERVHLWMAPRFCTTILGATVLMAVLVAWA